MARAGRAIALISMHIFALDRVQCFLENCCRGEERSLRDFSKLINGRQIFFSFERLWFLDNLSDVDCDRVVSVKEVMTTCSREVFVFGRRAMDADGKKNLIRGTLPVSEQYDIG